MNHWLQIAGTDSKIVTLVIEPCLMKYVIQPTSENIDSLPVNSVLYMEISFIPHILKFISAYHQRMSEEIRIQRKEYVDQE